VDSDFVPALEEAIAEGVLVVFSAGNNHEGHRLEDCSPTTIWSYKCRSDVLTVGACDLDGQMIPFSSRGPGERFGASGTSRKPDVVAPGPRNCRVPYGAHDTVLPRGWGTSGAAPQAAGLAASLLTMDPGLRGEQVWDVVRESARPHGLGPNCEGAGQIDCRRAIGRLK
jgi:subtilisin family serine protease